MKELRACAAVVVTIAMSVGVIAAADGRTVKRSVGPVAVIVDAPPDRVGLGETLEYGVTLLATADVEVKWPRHVAADETKFDTRTMGPDKIDRFLARRWFLRPKPTALGRLNPGSIAIEYRQPDEPWKVEEIPLPAVEIVQSSGAGKAVNPSRAPMDARAPTESDFNLRSCLRGLGIALFIAVLLALALRTWRGAPARL